MRYATIGTSDITDLFIKATRLFDGMDLVAVYSRDKNKGDLFAKKHNVTCVFTDLNELAQSELVDAVYIASPNSLHYEQSKLFIQNKKHVICEKPACASSEQVEHLQKLARENNVVYLEAIKMMFLPQRDLLQDAISKIGKVYTVNFNYSQLSSKYDDYISGHLPNIFNPKLATGCLNDIGIYCVYPALYYFGMPKKVISTAGILSSGADAFGNSIFIYDDMQVVLQYSKVGQSYGYSEIIGDKGTITIKSISCLTDIELIKKDKTRENIWADDSKELSMSHEAKKFMMYANDIEKYKKEYERDSEMTLAVSKMLEQIAEGAFVNNLSL